MTTALNAPYVANQPALQPVVDTLCTVLADTYTLQLLTQNHHWNVTGPLFYPLHKLFEEQYDELSEAVDGLAERIRALGAQSPASFAEFSRLSALPGFNGGDASARIANLVDAHEALIASLLVCLKASQVAGDEATADLMIERQRAHDKHLWMLRSQL
jgi:starvation-inducible DNA-binding protein